MRGAARRICLSRQTQNSASDLIDILLGQENWGRPNDRQIHFPKVMHGVGCWGFVVETYLRAGQGHSQRYPWNTNNSSHSKPSGNPWVSVVMLMQMVMITVASYGGSTVTETGGSGHGWLRGLASPCSEKKHTPIFRARDDPKLVRPHSWG